MEYQTESGLVVHDQRRHLRSNIEPNPDRERPIMTPTVLAGQNITPPPVVPWTGWPVEWATPNWGDTAGMESMLNRVSIVFGCLDLNSSILASMPPYRLAGQAVVDPLPWMQNPQPEVYAGWTEAMKQVVTAYWQGEAFLWATSRYGDGSVRQWVMLNPGWVDVELEGQMRRYYMGGDDITDDVLHLRYSSWPGLAHGVGPLEALSNNLFGASALEQYQSNLATRGGIPWGVLTAPGNLTQPQADEMRERWVSARLRSDGAPAVLSGGVTLTPFNLSPKDMALLELRQFDEARICTLLGVPPNVMGLPAGDSLTYRNAESMYDFHWRAYLRPRAAHLMEAISGWALPRGQQVQVNRDEYVRPSFETRVGAYKTLFDMMDETGRRAMTIDEIRRSERLAQLEVGEDSATEVEQLQRLGAPKQLILAKLGFSPEQIQLWQDMVDEEQINAARNQAAALGNINPYNSFGGQ